MSNNDFPPFDMPLLEDDAAQSEFEIEFYWQVLDRSHENVDVLRRLVELHGHRGEHGRALPLVRRLVDLRPADNIARYNLACTQAQLGHVSEALYSLGLAIHSGYDDVVQLETDPDLESLHDRIEFDQVIEECILQNAFEK